MAGRPLDMSSARNGAARCSPRFNFRMQGPPHRGSSPATTRTFQTLTLSLSPIAINNSHSAGFIHSVLLSTRHS